MKLVGLDPCDSGVSTSIIPIRAERRASSNRGSQKQRKRKVRLEGREGRGGRRSVGERRSAAQRGSSEAELVEGDRRDRSAKREQSRADAPRLAPSRSPRVRVRVNSSENAGMRQVELPFSVR